MKTDKYPRTYHMPWSPGATSDDKKLFEGWFDKLYKGKEVVITEKLDGSNTCFTCTEVYGRSHATPTRNPWDKNLWGSDGLLWKVKPVIGVYEFVFGENLYGVHSIEYNRLPEYFFVFNVYNNYEDKWYSWDDVVMMANCMEVPTVPVLYRGVIESEDELKKLVDKLMSEPSTFGDTKEGVVMRLADEFAGDDFADCVCKYVRANHVQTDEHWTRNWKKASLCV